MNLRTLAVVVCLAGLGCAAKKPVLPKPPDMSGLEQADAAVLQGCYDCLLDARATYRRIGAGAGRPAVLTRLFETDLLLILRHKELALDPSEPLAEAQALAKELPPEIDAARYLALVDAVPPDDVGMSHQAATAFRRAHAQSAVVLKINDELAWLKTGALRQPVRDYLDLAVDCAYPTRATVPGQPPRPARLDVRQPPAGAPPLIAYRTAICSVLNQPVLYRLRETEPRFVEASLYLARFDIAVADQMGPGRAIERLEEARARFPASPSASYLSGSINQAIGDCDAALAFYDETVALSPAHENALLGRTICLSYLKRPAEAIATATRMIALQTDNTSDAYYWRAWNRHNARDLEPARADIENAKKGGATAMVFTLAGEIAYDQSDLDPAEQNLKTGRVMVSGDTNCEAIWYLALVQTKRQGWLPAGRFFEQAMTCYEATADQNQRMLQGFEVRSDIDPGFKARKIATLTESVKELTSQRYAAALNAANYYATGGDIPPARRLVEIAATDPLLAEKVGKLREWLKDK